ncbi:uncharacterized protein LOC134810271 isoform X3 [Pan troglodytes]|uniref:uncharacterized protein LOC134810271 isoform X3 n=1 Tax=Pan troglodytes TaxID=9598 RepID=UPI0030132638
MCSGSRRPEPGARERPSPGRRPRQHPRQETRSRGRRCPEPGVNGCAAAGRVNEARRRGRRRRRRRPRRRRCGDWDAPWSPTARSLWAGPETLPLPGAPPPPPTWFQCCAQAGPAGGREGGRTGGARGASSIKSPGWSIQAADLFVILVQQSPPPLPLQGSASHVRSQNRKCWWTSLLAPRSSLEVPGTWCLCRSKCL